MKRSAAAFFLLLLLRAGFAEQLHEGDIIFHQSQSAQSEAIRRATHSPYTHMGILFRRDGRWFVYEAVQPVKATPLGDWIARGRGHHFVIERLRDDTILTPATLRRMRGVAGSYLGRSYDLYFDWSDQRIYCSELVWKVYKRGAGIEIGHLQRLRDFDLRDPVVRSKLHERYGDRIPLDEPAISPGEMFRSPALREVVRR